MILKSQLWGKNELKTKLESVDQKDERRHSMNCDNDKKTEIINRFCSVSRYQNVSKFANYVIRGFEFWRKKIFYVKRSVITTSHLNLIGYISVFLRVWITGLKQMFL